MNFHEPMGSSRAEEGLAGRRWSEGGSLDSSSISTPHQSGSQPVVTEPKVVHIRSEQNRPVFSLEEARQLLPVVFRLTRSYKDRVESMIQRVDSLSKSGLADELVARLEREVSSLILEWQSKIRRLGAEPQGLWIADFDSGTGYFCWKFPERTISHWHGYQDGFIRRQSI